MTQKFTVLFDLDGTLVDTAPDLMLAHNHVMKKFGYPTKSLDELKNTVGQGAGAMIGRSIWSQAKKELTSINEKIKNEMTDEFISYFQNFHTIEDYLRYAKKEAITSRSGSFQDISLKDKFFNKDIHPEDMDFEVKFIGKRFKFL